MRVPQAHTRYTGTVLFIAIHRIKTLSAETAYACLVELNAVLARSALLQILGAQWVGSTISGLFILIPDEAELLAHTYLAELFASCAESGLSIRVGVTHGRFICVDDADSKLNFAGKAINTAARLTYAEQNHACLVESSYEEHVRGFDSGMLERAPTCVVPGKEHDAGFVCRAFGTETFKVLSEVDRDRLPDHTPARFATGLVIAYDLPKFTAGDGAQIDKRVRSLVDAVRAFRQNDAGLRDAAMHFCPGGDGGIVVFEKVREQAYATGIGLARAFLTESEDREDAIAIDARIALHYGIVALYKDISGTLRPTGHTCFAADDLTADAPAKRAGLVFSEPLCEIISGGSERTLRNEFDELPLLTTGPAAGLRRFARKRNESASPSNPLIDQLFGPTSSWQLDR